MNYTFVIIGTSAAGLAAAWKLRSLAPDSNIICISAESEMPYNRCLLADMLAGTKSPDQIATKRAELFQENNIQLMLDARVIAIDRNNKYVVCENGSKISYNKLLIATGRSGTIAPISGTNQAGIFAFYGMRDCMDILAYIKKNNVTHATIIGAGFSGLECADALIKQGLSVTLVERSGQLLPQQLSQQSAVFLEEIIKKHDAQLYLHETITQIALAENHFIVSLKHHPSIRTGIIISATGGRINSTIAYEAGITMHDQSIMVNDYMQTNDPDVYAAGDVCAIKDQLSGQSIASCLWPDATQQGMIAAHNMAGIEKSYPGALIVTSSTIFSTTFVTCGPTNNPPARLRRLVKQSASAYHEFLLDDNNVLHGFCMIGNVDNIGQLRKKILSKEPLW